MAMFSMADKIDRELQIAEARKKHERAARLSLDFVAGDISDQDAQWLMANSSINNWHGLLSQRAAASASREIEDCLLPCPDDRNPAEWYGSRTCRLLAVMIGRMK